MRVLRQRTIKNTINCAGIGLHSGVNTMMTLRPAPPDTGIVFVRADRGRAAVPARWDHVTETTLGTTLENADGVTVITIEHLMAALLGCGIDNLYVELDGPEVPVMDGSSAPFVFLVECAGIADQDEVRREIRVLRAVAVSEGEKRLALTPSSGFSVNLLIDFDNPVVARQQLYYEAAPGAFKTYLSRARTFGFADDVAAMHAAGLARGGSLDNAVVISGDRVINEDGLRYEDEFVRHKMLDCIGDLYLAGAPLCGHVEAACSGHRLNNALLRALFADDANWCHQPMPESAGGWPERAVAARA
ncbi:MAG: UDP-3-O-acyl-N-acetylglucosamine deacetylase [Alphaproteobacteria bacterium]|nr:UDP-3-O-acyl-N-acetylglucosamine deacetylase [Alphaproteobacteria bacterium]MDP6517314.1 UDP-3-O-acyl-N-acetylglucosamine deacetylase [Alphaproteobacteria bacterium]